MEVNSHNRLFVALDPVPESRAALVELSEEVCRRGGGRPPPPENLHVTLAFVGRTEPDRIGALTDALSAALRGPPAQGRGSDLIARPNPRRARLLALSLADESDRLENLIAAAQIAAADALGRADPDIGAPWPHITLSRFRQPTRIDVRGVRDHLTHREQVFAFDRASLYNSEPQRAGPPHYRALATFRFE